MAGPAADRQPSVTKRRRKAKKRAESAHVQPPCDVCGERHKLHKLRVSMDGKSVTHWRICQACAAVKIVALFGQGPTGYARGLGATRQQQEKAAHLVRQRAKRNV